MATQALVDKIFSIKSNDEFNTVALDVFNYQYQNNILYKQYVDLLGFNPTELNLYSKIPFLPIEFFKTHTVTAQPSVEPAIVFSSSGTTGQSTSKHSVVDLNIYENSFIKGFEHFYGAVTDYCVLALLPSYLEREGSSLIYMVNNLMELSQNPDSGYYLYDYDRLILKLDELKAQEQKTLLIGVSFALLDLAKSYRTDVGSNCIVMETGGMKGRGKELTRTELHTKLTEAFYTPTIHSEYGMTELLSQAYSKGNGIFACPPWMKVLVRDITDPLTPLAPNQQGGLNIIDLANLQSCSFIATADIGRVNADNSFEVLGRYDHSDVRGCNLLVV